VDDETGCSGVIESHTSGQPCWRGGAGIVVTANPGSQKLVEESNKGDIKFSVANSQTITSGGNVYTVPVLLHFVDFGAFTWVAGDPAKGDVPVNPRWKSNAESADPLSDRANVLTVYPTGKATPILNVDFLFDTLPQHDEVPTDFDTWKMPITFVFSFPSTLAQRANRDFLTWTGGNDVTLQPQVTIADAPVPSNLAMASILLGISAVAWSYQRLKQTGIAA
jgi:hypothetical protein